MWSEYFGREYCCGGSPELPLCAAPTSACTGSVLIPEDGDGLAVLCLSGGHILCDVMAETSGSGKLLGGIGVDDLW